MKPLCNGFGKLLVSEIQQCGNLVLQLDISTQVSREGREEGCVVAHHLVTLNSQLYPVKDTANTPKIRFDCGEGAEG
eukprot:3302623-Amphidinium_carterae.1